MLLKRNLIVEMISGEIFIRKKKKKTLTCTRKCINSYKKKKHSYDKSTKLYNKNVF